ncbi:acetate--CoA ligase family protein [Phaeobacter sp. CAU 1743]|uniref:acetate--CoA ligase family protein n=1 Tax=Phaeobacter sp. CAU 1743 TaxID=3140367 RepID=UPI0023B5BF99
MNTDQMTLALDKMFRPASVAIVGASPKEGSPRNRIVKVLMKHGYQGRVYPVTPSSDEVEGHKAYKTLADLPEVPDVALVITPASTVPGIIRECGAKGITSAIVFSSGFEETDAGKELAVELKKAADETGIVVIGPNCNGAWSVKEKAILTFGSAAFSMDPPEHSNIALISQSGALAGAMGNYLQKNKLGSSYIVTLGNETCTDALDVLSWVIEQDDVSAVALYLEGLSDAGRFISLAARARTRGIQIVALKAGRSAFGQEATASHTGKIASPYGIYTDVLEQAGVTLVESLGELLAAVEVLALLPAPRLSGDPLGGISVLSSSGGAGALLADHCEEYDLPMAKFSDDTAARLEEVLPEFARKANPIDLTGQIRSQPDLFRNSLAAVAADKRTEAIVVQFASSGLRDLIDNAEDFKAAARDTGLPILISFAAETVDAAIKEDFHDAGIYISNDPGFTMRALRWIYDRQRYTAIVTADDSGVPAEQTVPETWEETMTYLDGCGVPAAKWTILNADDNAATACAGLQYPLVVKALPSEAEHKTELGLVKLRVGSPEEVDAHAAEFRKITGKPEMGVLVQEMITDGVEVVLSALTNTDFGPVMSIGSGGVAIELYRDVTFLALPCTAEQVETALKKLKLWTLLDGFRGSPRADIPALINAAVRFGNMIVATPDIAEAEINPVLVRPEGKGLAAVDFLCTTK